MSRFDPEKVTHHYLIDEEDTWQGQGIPEDTYRELYEAAKQMAEAIDALIKKDFRGNKPQYPKLESALANFQKEN